MLLNKEILSQLHFVDNSVSTSLGGPFSITKGSTIEKHMNNIAQILVKENYLKLKKLSETGFTLSVPKTLTNSPGWNLWNEKTQTWETNYDIHELDKQALIIDTETFVKDNPDFPFPIIAQAISTYGEILLWVHPSICGQSPWSHELVPVPSNCVLIAHNVAYDRPRCEYNPTNVWFDTMSAHINVSGLLSGQRFMYTKKAPMYYRPKWYYYGSLNSLVDTYNFHVAKPQNRPLLTKDDKLSRDIFVDATSIEDFRETDTYNEAVAYGIKDVIYTLDLFRALFPKYIDNNPSPSTLFAHLELTRAIVPVVPNWNDWKTQCDKLFNEAIAEQSLIFGVLAEEVLEKGNPEEYPELDWSSSTRGKFKGIPKWYVPIVKGETLTTKSKLSHILLKLRWKDNPIYFTTSRGLCYRDTYDVENQIPHPDGIGKNVGSILTKEFIVDVENGVLTSDLGNETLMKVMRLSERVSFWTSIRSRVHGQNVINDRKFKWGWIVAPITPHNTSTNRVGDPLFLTVCEPQYNKIGSETKSRVQAPPGYTFVQTDVDGQEAMIAAIFGDAYEKKTGSTAFSRAILSGTKEDGTDMHSVTAKQVGISRSIAKNLNYGLLYGSGVKTCVNTIISGDKTIPYHEAERIAKLLIEKKKGKKNHDGYFEDGEDSRIYNEMIRIASMPVSINPLSGTKMSTAFRSENSGTTEFTMSKNNWCIQSTGAAFLHYLMSATKYLCLYGSYPVKNHRFIMSIHDSICYMVPLGEELNMARNLQIAHLWTWALLRYKYGLLDFPVENAWFSSIEIDPILRKTPEVSTHTISQSDTQERTGYSLKISDLFNL